MVNRDPVKRAASQRRYYEKNREKVRERQRVQWASPEKKTQRKCYLARPEVRKRMVSYVLKYRATKKGQLVAKKASRRHLLKKLYGVSSEQYARMLAAQKGGCALCGGVNNDGRPLFVDHNHNTKKVRELLCLSCNSMIGHCRESVELLTAGAAYLRKHLTIL